MSFDDASKESRERFSEALCILNHLAETAPKGLVASRDIDKAMKGLWLVSLYGAFERSVNSTVEQSIFEISSHNSPSYACVPSIYSIFHHSRVQSVKYCNSNIVFEKSTALFQAVMDSAPLNMNENPLADMLQNVNGGTLNKIISYFGAPSYQIEPQSIGRLNMLRERRNAVAHGREAASQVGESYTFSELRKLYEVADFESTRFYLHMKEYCESKLYIKAI